MKQAPDEILSERILAEIEKQQLLSKKAINKLRVNYPQGKVTLHDWVLSAELSMEAKDSNDK